MSRHASAFIAYAANPWPNGVPPWYPDYTPAGWELSILGSYWLEKEFGADSGISFRDVGANGTHVILVVTGSVMEMVGNQGVCELPDIVAKFGMPGRAMYLLNRWCSKNGYPVGSWKLCATFG